jgi:peptidoglycan hydrolase CwlO-like protein
LNRTPARQQEAEWKALSKDLKQQIQDLKRNNESIQEISAQNVHERDEKINSMRKEIAELKQQIDAASKRDAEELIAFGSELQAEVVIWLRQKHPKLLPR